jgi:hypothetical protein
MKDDYMVQIAMLIFQHFIPNLENLRVVVADNADFSLPEQLTDFTAAQHPALFAPAFCCVLTDT